MRDKYKAVWLSYSSLNDFQKCHRLYYLKNMFKDPRTRRKVNIASPYLTLGSTVHKVIENLKNIKTEARAEFIKNNLASDFEREWQKYTLESGGFKDEGEQKDFYERGLKMIEKVVANPKYLLNKIIPQKYFYDGDMIPNYFIDEENDLILCGSVDWVEYLPTSDQVRIIDFKTGRNDESDSSWQLPIYYLLFSNLQKLAGAKKEFSVAELAYWYLDQENKKSGNEHDEFEIKKVDDSELAKIEQVKLEILKLGLEIKKFREGGEYICNHETSPGEGCRHCRDFERVYKFIQTQLEQNNNETKTIDLLEAKKDNVEYVGVSDYNQDVYYLK